MEMASHVAENGLFNAAPVCCERHTKENVEDELLNCPDDECESAGCTFLLESLMKLLTLYDESDVNSKRSETLRMDSGYHSAVDEDEADSVDGLYPLQVTTKIRPSSDQKANIQTYDDYKSHTKCSAKTKQNISSSCMPGKKVTKEVEESALKIKHEGSEPGGDYFGVSLVSKRYKSQKGSYWVHTFYNFSKGLPNLARALKLSNDDELVMVNDRFVAHCNNSEVVQMFWNQPVDCVTPLKLLIRRKISSEKYKWISIRCLLSPEDKNVHVTGRRINDIENPRVFRIRLKVGSKYLCVDNGKLNFRDLNDHDDPNGILRIMKEVVVDSPECMYRAALETSDKSSKFIGPNKDQQLTLLDGAFFFSYLMDGNYTYFTHRDVNGNTFYLTRDKTRAVLTLDKCGCEMFPAEKFGDEIDCLKIGSDYYCHSGTAAPVRQ